MLADPIERTVQAVVAATATTLAAWTLRPPAPTPPSAAAIATVFAAGFALSLALASRELSMARLGAAVALSQTVGSVIFMVEAGALAGLQGPPGSLETWANGAASPLHVMACLALVVALRHAEVLTVAVARRTSRFASYLACLFALPAPAVAVPAPPRLLVPHPTARLSSAEPHTPVTSRGPPPA